MLDQLRKNGFFANLKKFRFYKDKVCFLSYVISVKGVQMKDERMDVVKNWLEAKSM